jgi:N-[(2S)-2-amino-2-carboxyethyl]-L-glutamate dehydrogenase
MSLHFNRADDLNPDDIIVLGAKDVHTILDGREAEILDIVANAYRQHALGETTLPHSLFLGFPDNARNRIIALPARLGTGAAQSVGMKWISSFPKNIDNGLDRASAIVVLNSIVTGRPRAVIEGALISAKRTAASAALAARLLCPQQIKAASMVGCGIINLEIARFLQVVAPGLTTLYIYDLNAERALQYKTQAEIRFPRLEIVIARTVHEVLESAALISFATTSSEPHIHDLSMCSLGTVILHVSLRDIAPEVIMASDNVVDDVDHVCRAQTSVHLAAQRSGHHAFIRGTLGDILVDGCAPRAENNKTVIFSPFGLGILDIALGEFVLQQASAQHLGVMVPSFFSSSWTRVPATT